MNGFTFPIVTLGTIRPGDMGACMGVDPLDMPRTPYRAGEEKRSQ